MERIQEIEGASFDTLDSKATGLLIADIAGGTVLVAFHSALGSTWLGPAVGLAFAAAFFLRAIRTMKWDYGPDVEVFRRETDGMPPTDAIAKMVADLKESWAVNARIVGAKSRLVRWGYSLLYVSLVGALIAAAIHSSTT
jgi:hypothetical protein